MTYWEVVSKIVRQADIILVVMDARMPDLSRSTELEKMVAKRNKKLFLVFNKIDLVSEDYLSHLKRGHGDAFFVAGVKNIGISNLKRHILIAAKRLGIEDPKVGVVGYPNVGKSAIINAIAHRAKAQMSPVAGTTKGMQIIRAGSIHILDSPGVFPYKDSDFKLGIIAAKNPEQIRNPDLLACKIIRMFKETNKKALEELYGVSIEDSLKDDSYEIMLSIGERRKYLLQGGVIDERRTALQIIRDWQSGKLRI